MFSSLIEPFLIFLWFQRGKISSWYPGGAGTGSFQVAQVSYLSHLQDWKSTCVENVPPWEGEMKQRLIKKSHFYTLPSSVKPHTGLQLQWCCLSFISHIYWKDYIIVVKDGSMAAHNERMTSVVNNIPIYLNGFVFSLLLSGLHSPHHGPALRYLPTWLLWQHHSWFICRLSAVHLPTEPPQQQVEFMEPETDDGRSIHYEMSRKVTTKGPTAGESRSPEVEPSSSLLNGDEQLAQV